MMFTDFLVLYSKQIVVTDGFPKLARAITARVAAGGPGGPA